MIGSGQEKSIHLRDYIDVIKRRRLPILAVFLVVVGLVATYTFLATKQYTATTQLLIEQGAQRSFSLQDALAVDASAMDFYQTQYRLIESRAIAEKVVKQLQLYKLHEFGAPLPGETPEKKLTPEQKIRQAAEIFLTKVKVTPIRQSRLVNISFTSGEPVLAAKVANAIAKAYIDYVLDRKLRISQMAVNFLGRRIDEQRRKLQASQLSLQKYMEDNKLVNVISDDYNTITSQKLAELNQKLIEAETSRKEAEARYRLALKARSDTRKLDSIREFLDSPVIQKVRERDLEISKREAELSQKYGSRHPKMLALQAEKKAIEQQRNGEINQIINSLDNQYRIALTKENAIRQALEHQKEDAMITRKKAIGFNVIKREVDTNQQLFNMLLAKVKEARITEEIDVGSVMVVDSAEVPHGPSKPRVRLNLALAVLGGLILSLFWGFLLEYMDNTIKLPSQIEDQLGLPLLGSVPFDTTLHSPRGKGNTDQAPVVLAALSRPNASTIEPLRIVRTAISLSKAGSPPRSIVVSSSLEREGKSVTAACLAVAFAEANKRTIIIDADLRKPRQHRLWNKNNNLGLSTVLSGQSSIQNCVHADVIPNVDVITSGPIPPSPSELFQSELMGRVMEVLGKAYDQIIIDSPPILPLADPLILGSLADGLILVAAAAKIPVHVLEQSVNKLNKAGIDLLGVILNQVEKGRSDYYYGGYKHRYYYQYGYGEQKSK
ncbi:MAG: polysaccharide biosynthesis tyrosine autokinase [Desulfarculaceae bacterium]|nr:polysaccharide biosynthesis tyrosine autokinase [Desulfarculaceae bacterium]